MISRFMEYGEIFNCYKIGEFSGSGGSSEVYSAEHLVLKQLHAVKIMSGNQDAQQIKRFIREAQLTYNIEHPDIVKTFNAGSDNKTGKAFIFMVNRGIKRLQVNGDISAIRHSSSSLMSIFSIRQLRLLSCCSRLIAPVARNVSSKSF